MTSKVIKGHKVFFVIFVVAAFSFLMRGGVFAKIPEPDNIIYGVARDDTVRVALEVEGEEISSYTMGDNPEAGDYYVLRVPMDSLAPAEPGTARVGDLAYVFINDEPEPAARVTLGIRGTIHRLDLNIEDSDSDGLPDDFEQQIIDADPNDNIATFLDVERDDDFDGDGESNWEEWQYGSSPIDAMSARRGDIDGDKYVSLADAVLVLKVLCGMGEPGDVSLEGDVNGDGKVGTEEALYITQKVSATRW
jgi:hypothetical protein